jgi:hypothetical protein
LYWACAVRAPASATSATTYQTYLWLRIGPPGASVTRPRHHHAR